MYKAFQTIGIALSVILVVSGVSYFFARDDHASLQKVDASNASNDRPDAPGEPHPAPSEGSAARDLTPVDSNDRYAELAEKYAPPDFSVVSRAPLPEVTSSGSWNDLRTRLWDPATRGDAQAAFDLYRAARECATAPRTPAELEQKIKRVTAPYYGARGGRWVETPANTEQSEQRLRALFDFCQDADIDELNEYPRWVEVAAEAGDVRAQLEAYGTEYPGDRGRDVREPEYAAALGLRRQRFLDNLERAKASGSLDAALRLYSFYLTRSSEERQAGPDAYQDLKRAFANLYPYAWYQLKYEGSDGAFRPLESIGNRLKPNDYYEALEDGRRFLASPECCFKLPEP